MDTADHEISAKIALAICLLPADRLTEDEISLIQRELRWRTERELRAIKSNAEDLRRHLRSEPELDHTNGYMWRGS